MCDTTGVNRVCHHLANECSHVPGTHYKSSSRLGAGVEGTKRTGKRSRWTGRRGGQGPPSEKIFKGRGQRRGSPPGKREGGVIFCLCAGLVCDFFCLFSFKVHRYAGEPRHIGGHPLGRGPPDGDRKERRREKKGGGKTMQLTWPSRASNQLDKYT